MGTMESQLEEWMKAAGCTLVKSSGDKLTDWARRLGINPATVAVRLFRGKSVEEALTP